MRRIRFMIGVTLSICLVSCGRAEQTPSGKMEEGSKIHSGQEVPDNTSNENQVVVQSGLDYPVYEDAESLVKASDAIFSGIVLDITKEDLSVLKGNDAEKLPYMIYEVKIDTLYQGEVTDNVIKIKHFNTGIKEDALHIEEGVPYLFLVELYDDSYPSLVNADQSIFEMDTKQTKGAKRYSTNKENEKQKISFDDVMAMISDQ